MHKKRTKSCGFHAKPVQSRPQNLYFLGPYSPKSLLRRRCCLQITPPLVYHKWDITFCPHLPRFLRHFLRLFSSFFRFSFVNPIVIMPAFYPETRPLTSCVLSVRWRRDYQYSDIAYWVVWCQRPPSKVQVIPKKWANLVQIIPLLWAKLVQVLHIFHPLYFPIITLFHRFC